MYTTELDEVAEMPHQSLLRDLRRGGGGRGGRSSRSSSRSSYYYGGTSYGNCYGDRCSSSSGSSTSGWVALGVFCCVFCCVFNVVLCKNGACDGCCKKNGKRSYNKDSAKGDELGGTKDLGDSSDGQYDSWEDSVYEQNES